MGGIETIATWRERRRSGGRVVIAGLSIGGCMRALIRSHCLQFSAIGELKGGRERGKRATEDGDVRERAFGSPCRGRDSHQICCAALGSGRKKGGRETGSGGREEKWISRTMNRGRRVAVVEGKKSRRERRSSPEEDDGRRGEREPQDLHTRRCKPQRSEHVRRKRKWRTEKGEERREGSEGREIEKYTRRWPAGDI